MGRTALTSQLRRGRSYVVVFPVIFTGVPAALGSSATAAARAPASASAPASAARAGSQSLREVWLAGASTAWAWTADLSGGAQGLARTTDGGARWARVTPPGLGTQTGNRFISGFFALGPMHAWVAFGGVASSAVQTIAATSDGARRWTVIGRVPSIVVPPSPFTYGCNLDFVNPADGWCPVIVPFFGSEAVYLFRTADGGKHWRLISKAVQGSNPPGSLQYGCDKNIQFTNRAVGWAGYACAGGLAPIYQTVNGGRTWVKRDVARPSGTLVYGSGFAGVPVVDGARGAVGYTISGPRKAQRSVVYVSTDAGASWRSVTPPGGQRGWLVDVMTPVIWRLVSGHQILATDNGGRSWRTINSNVGFNLFFPADSPAPPVVDFVTGKIGWIVSASLWRTVDGGHRWRRVVIPGT